MKDEFAEINEQLARAFSVDRPIEIPEEYRAEQRVEICGVPFDDEKTTLWVKTLDQKAGAGDVER